MATLVQLALAPVAVCALYLFVRDRYEKEPVGFLSTGLLYGAYCTAAVVALCAVLDRLMPEEGTQWGLFYSAFVTSAGVEESMKLLFLFCLVWTNPNFNEPFDGIVYAAFVALGFAMVENVIYVLHPAFGGFQTAVSRAIFSVPGHGFFGVAMGYFLALAKYEPKRRGRRLAQAFFVPWLLHSIYNLILLLDLKHYLIVFLPFVAFLWRGGFRKMERLLKRSPFRPRRRDFSASP